MKQLIVLFVVIIGFALPASAQTKTDCSAAAYSQIFASNIAALQMATADDLDNQLSNVLDAILSKRATCAGLSFQGDHSGVVVGPIDIPAGTYRVKFTGPTLSVALTLLSGQCDELHLYNSRSSTGAQEHVFQSQGCRVLLEIHALDNGSWSLEFQSIP